MSESIYEAAERIGATILGSAGLPTDEQLRAVHERLLGYMHPNAVKRNFNPAVRNDAPTRYHQERAQRRADGEHVPGEKNPGRKLAPGWVDSIRETTGQIQRLIREEDLP